METLLEPSALDLYIARAKAAEIPDSTLIPVLREHKWPRHEILRSLGRYYVDHVGMLPPLAVSSSENARDAFYYLINFITLAFWITALGRIFYVLIEDRFPDRATYTFAHPLIDQLAWELAVVIVTFPVFALVHRLLEREMRRRTDLPTSGVRQWLTYIALVGASLVVLMDGVWFVNALLRGEATTRFLLDSLVLLVLGGGVFAYYMSGLRAASDR